MITMAPIVCQVFSEGCLPFLITVSNKHMWHVPQEAMDHGWVMMSLHLSYECILEWQEPLSILSECLQETRWKNKWKRTAGLPVHVPFQLSFFGRLQEPLFAPIHWVFLLSPWRLHDSFYKKLRLGTSVSGSWHYQAQSPWPGKVCLAQLLSVNQEVIVWVPVRAYARLWDRYPAGLHAGDNRSMIFVSSLVFSLSHWLFSLKSIKMYIFKKSLTWSNQTL